MLIQRQAPHIRLERGLILFHQKVGAPLVADSLSLGCRVGHGAGRRLGLTGKGQGPRRRCPKPLLSHLI